MAKLETQIIIAMAGFDVGLLQQAMSDSTSSLDVVLPSDPNRGWGAPAVVADSTLQHGILQATSHKEAVPKAWQGQALSNEGKPRIKADLLTEVRGKIVVNEELLAQASQRLVVIQAEAELRQASDGDDLNKLLAAISKCEGIDGVNEELLAGSKVSSVKKAEAQLSASCDGGVLATIQAVLDSVSVVKGINVSVLENARQTLVKIAEDQLRTAVSGEDAEAIRSAVMDAEAVEGVNADLLADALTRMQELQRKACFARLVILKIHNNGV